MRITLENWPEDWAAVPEWTPVSREVYDHFLNSVPPVDFQYDRFQAGEAYDTAVDSEGRHRNRYMTFGDCGNNGGCFYLGLRFRKDYPERNSEAINEAMKMEGLE